MIKPAKMKDFWIILSAVWIIILFYAVFYNYGSPFPIDGLKNPKNVSLPIDNEYEAIQHSLSFQNVRENLNEAPRSNLSKFKIWDASAFLNVEKDWNVTWRRGSDCMSDIYARYEECIATLEKDGKLKYFKCNENFCEN